ncbi:mammalian cell entry protein [Tibeticola sp.]|uniref:MlaD family protein n=1 Tax=Tibeticola sp. TaxID=2005368 RepID=UPI00259013E6|nr:mammalian cell entry protein [Tibeticola sp.]
MSSSLPSSNESVAAADLAAPDPRLARRARWLVLAVLALVVASVLYLLYARGVFEQTQRVVLVADDSEGVSIGMDMTFAGFPLGRVSRIELAPSGRVRILVDVARKDAHWLRETSVFTLERGLVGGAKLRAYTGMVGAAPLPDGAERELLIGDANAQIPRLLSDVRDLLANVRALTAHDAPLAQTLADVHEITGRIKGPRGALGVLFGNEADARRLLTTLERTNALLARLDALGAQTQTQVFGAQGLVPSAREATQQLGGLLADTRASLQKLDEVLTQVEAVAANAKEGTADLGALRAEVESNLRRVEDLMNEINRKWPFARNPELRLP